MIVRTNGFGLEVYCIDFNDACGVSFVGVVSVSVVIDFFVLTLHELIIIVFLECCKAKIYLTMALYWGSGR